MTSACIGPLLSVREFLWSVKTEPAFSATIGTYGEEKQDPVFQHASAFSPMHVHAPATGARFLRMVDEKSKSTPHRYGNHTALCSQVRPYSLCKSLS
jgi:hypothetical protein